MANDERKVPGEKKYGQIFLKHSQFTYVKVRREIKDQY